MKMKPAKRWLALASILSLLLVFLPSCDNPFDPLDEADEIKGLTYFDWSLSWDRWDSDPEYDGVLVTLEYFNEFGDSLEFTDKSHTVKVEFYTQKNVGGEEDETGNIVGGYTTFDRLVFSHTATFKNTDDDIRIPVELYIDALRGAGLDLEDVAGIAVYGVVRVFPPKGKPQRELVVGYPDNVVFMPETELTPNP